MFIHPSGYLICFVFGFHLILVTVMWGIIVCLMDEETKGLTVSNWQD